MATSNSGIRMIKSFEGLSLRAYRCPAGVMTIGYGHTGNVREGQTCTEMEAEMWLREDIRNAERTVGRIQASRPLRQNEYDALVSFAYNVGVNAFERSTLYSKVTADPDDPSIRQEFKKWIYSNGNVLPGLVSRRDAEADMYFNA